jgi:acyl carrier protein
MKNEAQQKATKENLINFLKQNLKLNLPIEELLEEKIINLDMDSLDLLDLNFNILQTFGVEIKLEKLTPESSLLEIIEQLIAVQ